VAALSLLLLGLLPLRVVAAEYVYGRVSDAQTHEGLLGVSVQVKGSLRGAATDADGHYHIHLPADSPPFTGGPGGVRAYTLRLTSIGYKPLERELSVSPGDSLELNLTLEPDLLQADEVLVTAEARETTARLSTTKVDVVTQQQVTQRSPSSLDKVLDAVPGLEVHRTGGAVVSNVSIRGSSDMLGGGVGNRTLLLVDGKPAVISDTDGASWWLYPEEIIDRVEVVKGAYSSLYGSNAMGGVVNLLTRTPGFREFTRIRATSGFYERPPSWMRYSDRLKNLGSISFSHSNTVGRLGYFASATRRQSDGFRESSVYENTVLFTKLKYDYSPQRGITFSSLSLTGDNEYPHPWVTTLAPLRVRDIYSNDIQRKRTLANDLVYRRLENHHSSYTLRLFHNYDLTRSLLNPASDPRDGEVPVGFETRSISQKFGVLEQSTRLWKWKNTLVFGFESVWDHVNGKPDDYLYGIQQAWAGAGFFQNEWAPGKLRATVGARFDYRHLVGHNSTNQLSPKFGLSYDLRSDLVARGSVGHAFRNPSIAEMFLKKVGGQDYQFDPNPNLDPETVDFGEAGFNYKLDDYAVLDGAAFLYKYQNMIRWQTIAAGHYRTENLSTARIAGGELAIRAVQPRGLRQTLAFTYLDTDIDNQGPLTYVPKWRVAYSVMYEYKDIIASADWRYIGKTDTVIFYQNDAPKAVELLDLRLTFRFHQSTRLGFIVDNVTNQFYEEMERYRMPPRTYRMELIYEFDVEK
jgi:iron complex outermembrane recepter protein